MIVRLQLALLSCLLLAVCCLLLDSLFRLLLASLFCLLLALLFKFFYTLSTAFRGQFVVLSCPFSGVSGLASRKRHSRSRAALRALLRTLPHVLRPRTILLVLRVVRWQLHQHHFLPPRAARGSRSSQSCGNVAMPLMVRSWRRPE